jgi:hypothetical protein
MAGLPHFTGAFILMEFAGRALANPADISGLFPRSRRSIGRQRGNFCPNCAQI